MMKSTNFTKVEKLTVLEEAKAIIVGLTQWPNGEVKTVVSGTYNGHEASLSLSNGHNGITLSLFVEGKTLMDRFYSQPFTVGYFNPETGFEVSKQATEASYLQWNQQVRRAMK